MAQSPTSLAGREDPEFGSETAEYNYTDSESTDASMDSHSQEGTFPECDCRGMPEPCLHGDPLDLMGSVGRIFHTGRSRLSSEWLQILQEGNKRYPLRDTDRNNFRGSGFHDMDKSGDWHPDAELKTSAKPLKPLNRKPLKIKDIEAGDGDREKPKLQQRTLSYEQGRKNGRSMYLTLQISSEEGKEKFKALIEEHLSSKTCAEDSPQGEFANSSVYLANGTIEASIMGQAGVTIRRSTIKDSEITHDHPYQSKETEYENLLGRREARGCRDCYDIGVECSLVDDALSYPCETCKEDDQDCILIIPSKEKQPCEQCKHKKLYCSYTHERGEDVIAACENCQDANLICVAGPAKSSRIDDVLSSIKKEGGPTKVKDKTRNRPQIPAQKPGGVGRRRQTLPRENVAERRPKLQPSNRRSAPSSKRGRNGKQKKRLRKSRGRKAGPKPEFNINEANSTSVPGGKVMHITTSFCHPISFNWIPPPALLPFSDAPSAQSSQKAASSYPCHFCTDPGLPYALAGLGIRRVEVIQWDYDLTLGYEELDDGWVQAGEECTRMCVQCTMERVLICLCTDHVIRPISGLEPRTFDFEGAIQGVLNQNLNRGKGELGIIADTRSNMADIKWCSICIEPAFFECCVTPLFDSSGRETSPSDDIGCGLLLCEVCALKMRGQQRGHSGDAPASMLTPPSSSDGTSVKKQSEEHFKTIMTLDQHISAASHDYFQYPDGLRADVCFLKSDGELMRRQGAEDVFEADGDELYMAEYGDLGVDEIEDRPSKRRNFESVDLIDLT